MKKLFVLGIAALLLVAFSVPVMAEVKIGGIIFTDFYYLSRNSKSAATYGQGTGQTSYGNTVIQLPNITRLYARWTNEDNVGMYIELGIGQGAGNVQGSADDANSSNVRHAYGWWDVNPMFQIMAGQSTTPFSPLNPSQLLGTRSGSVNIIGAGYGEFYSGRFVQVRGTFNFSKAFGIALAIVDPNGGASQFANVTIPGIQTNTKLPRFDLGAHVNLGPVTIYPSVMWQQRTFDKDATVWPAGIDDSVTTYAGSLGVKFGMGPFMLEAEGQVGKNWANTRCLIGGSPVARNSSITIYNGGLDDTTNFGYWVDLAFKLGPATPHLIFGQMGANGDKNPLGYRSMMYGVSVPITMAKGFTVRPEAMWYNDGDNNTPNGGGPAEDSGSYGIYGVQFQITF
jgi:hypothetical protein